jgi:hypothetical protein
MDAFYFSYFKGPKRSKHFICNVRKKVKNGVKKFTHIAPLLGLFRSFWGRYGLK